MIAAEKNFQSLQHARTELAKQTTANFDQMRAIHEQALLQCIRGREAAESSLRDELKGMIQTMRDEIQDLRNADGGTPTPRGDDDRQVRRKIDSGLVGNPSRLVVLGFPRPLMEKTLREAVQSILAR
eukprot:7036260-Pyramimonas_sp.AAC.1